ncbi:Spy/CpxP family protein refolding chaperone [Fibrella sp. WM1]|uniref:Spy/CpxP family protein refolding chaperone n=1 Tax=Fibrella musci TaxID=3242485 RepID=UPI003522FF0F
MNNSHRIRLLIGLVIALAALNIGLLAWLWLKPARPVFGRNRLTNPTFLADTLKFNASQRQQLDSLQKRYFGEVRPRFRQLRNDRKAYFRLVDATFTAEQRRTQRLAFYQKSAELDSITLAHFDNVAALCTPPQRQLLSKLLTEMPRRNFRRTAR